MSTTPELSVIIPVYGTEKYIDKCLQSALKATKDVSAEILVINDGTKDKAGEIAQGYAKSYPDRLFYYEKENGGLSDTKNYGLNLAKGEYVAFLDSDDYIEPEMYVEMLKTAHSEDADCVVCDISNDFVDSGKVVVQKGRFEREDSYYALIDTPPMASSCNKLMKRNLFAGLSFPVKMNNEDVAVTPIAMGRSKMLAYVPKAFYHYIQREGSIQNSEFTNKRFVVLDICQMALERAKELPEMRQEMLKGAIYVHQILAVVYYAISLQPAGVRRKLLKEYMSLVEEKFPDLFDNEEVHEYTTWSGKVTNTYRKMCLSALRHRNYGLCSFLFGVMRNMKK